MSHEGGPFEHLPDHVGDALEWPVDEERIHRIWQGSRDRMVTSRGRSAKTMVLFGGGIVAAAALLLFVWPRGVPDALLRLESGGVPGAYTVAVSEETRELVFAEGSQVTIEPASRLIALRNEAGAFDVELERGDARFSVTPGLGRRWRVFAGPLRVEVIGTEFDVQHRTSSVDVRVRRGTVRVFADSLPDGVVTLHAGDSIEVPREAPELAVGDVPPDHPLEASALSGHLAQAGVLDETPDSMDIQVAASARMLERDAPDEPVRIREAPATPRSNIVVPGDEEGGSVPAEEPRWREMARAGEHVHAYEELGREGLVARTVQAEPDELMMLADIARLSGHAMTAVGPLTRLMEEHSGDSRAAIAAALLGRLEMDRLDRPQRARRALQQALELGLPSALRPDVESRLRRLTRDSEAAQPAP